MYLTKVQSRVLAVALIVLFFIGATFVLHRHHQNSVLPGSQSTSPQSPTNQSNANQTEASNEALFVLHDFRRSAVENGRKVWEIQAQQGEYLNSTNAIRLSTANLWLFRPNGDSAKMTSGIALIKLDGTNLSHADASNGVVITFKDEVQMKTEVAAYDRAANVVTAPGAVQIHHHLGEITGVGLEAHLDRNEIKILHDVTTMIRPSKEG